MLAMNTHRAEITYSKVHADGSGATALVKIGGFTFALDFLGDVKCTQVGGPGYHTPTNAQIAQARRVYVSQIVEHQSPAWLARNAAMYSRDPRLATLQAMSERRLLDTPGRVLDAPAYVRALDVLTAAHAALTA